MPRSSKSKASATGRARSFKGQARAASRKAVKGGAASKAVAKRKPVAGGANLSPVAKSTARKPVTGGVAARKTIATRRSYRDSR